MLISQVEGLPTPVGESELGREIARFNLGLQARIEEDVRLQTILDPEAQAADAETWRSRRAALMCQIVGSQPGCDDADLFERDAWNFFAQEIALEHANEIGFRRTVDATTLTVAVETRRALFERRHYLGLPDSACPWPPVMPTRGWRKQARYDKALALYRQQVEALLRRGKPVVRLPKGISDWKLAFDGRILARVGQTLESFEPNLGSSGKPYFQLTGAWNEWAPGPNGLIYVQRKEGFGSDWVSAYRPDDPNISIRQHLLKDRLAVPTKRWGIDTNGSILECGDPNSWHIRAYGPGHPDQGDLRCQHYGNLYWSVCPDGWFLITSDGRIVKTRHGQEHPSEWKTLAILPATTRSWQAAPGGIVHDCSPSPDGTTLIRFVPFL